MEQTMNIKPEQERCRRAIKEFGMLLQISRAHQYSRETILTILDQIRKEAYMYKIYQTQMDCPVCGGEPVKPNDETIITGANDCIVCDGFGFILQHGSNDSKIKFYPNS